MRSGFTDGLTAELVDFAKGVFCFFQSELVAGRSSTERATSASIDREARPQQCGGACVNTSLPAPARRRFASAHVAQLAGSESHRHSIRELIQPRKFAGARAPVESFPENFGGLRRCSSIFTHVPPAGRASSANRLRPRLRCAECGPSSAANRFLSSRSARGSYAAETVRWRCRSHCHATLKQSAGFAAANRSRRWSLASQIFFVNHRHCKRRSHCTTALQLSGNTAKLLPSYAKRFLRFEYGNQRTCCSNSGLPACHAKSS